MDLLDSGVMNSVLYGSFIVVLECFVISWMSWRCVLRGILEGQTLLERFATVCVFHNVSVAQNLYYQERLMQNVMYSFVDYI